MYLRRIRLLTESLNLQAEMDALVLLLPGCALAGSFPCFLYGSERGCGRLWLHANSNWKSASSGLARPGVRAQIYEM